VSPTEEEEEEETNVGRVLPLFFDS